MGKIYEHQTKLRIILDTEEDITAAITKEIRWEKPDHSRGAWTATTLDALAGTIYYDVASTDTLDQFGKWKLWSWVTFSDNRSAAGETVLMRVYEEGT